MFNPEYQIDIDIERLEAKPITQGFIDGLYEILKKKSIAIQDGTDTDDTSNLCGD